LFSSWFSYFVIGKWDGDGGFSMLDAVVRTPGSAMQFHPGGVLFGGGEDGGNELHAGDAVIDVN